MTEATWCWRCGWGTAAMTGPDRLAVLHWRAGLCGHREHTHKRGLHGFKVASHYLQSTIRLELGATTGLSTRRALRPHIQGRQHTQRAKGVAAWRGHRAAEERRAYQACQHLLDLTKWLSTTWPLENTITRPCGRHVCATVTAGRQRAGNPIPQQQHAAAAAGA